MKKLQVNISPEEWGSLVTKYHPASKKVTVASFTEGTKNIETDRTGAITKITGAVAYNATLLAAAAKDQYEAVFSDGAHHLLVVQSGEVKYSSGDTVFNTVTNGSGFTATGNFEMATFQDRVYMGNGIDAPQVYDKTASYGGVSYAVPRMKAMGLQAPSAAPTVAVAAGGAVPIGGHTYKITFVYYDGQESNGGPASAVATTFAANQTVNLTAIPIGGYGVSSRNIYRDNNDGVWAQVGSIANNTATTFSDTSATVTFPIPVDNNGPQNFRFISLWLSRLWTSGVNGEPYTIFYSEADSPDIYFPENLILCNSEDPITAHTVYFDRLVVFNRRSMGQILGNTPDSFRYSAIQGSVGCVDNRTIQVRVVNGVPVLLWLSDKGFYRYDGNSVEYISDPIEDLVNVNIQQALQQKNSHTQTTQADFTAGTASNGIDLATTPNSITTQNPKRVYDDSTDWSGGLTTTNTKIFDGTNKLKNPRFNAFSASAGTHNGTVPVVRSGYTHVELPTATTLASETTNASATASTFLILSRVAMRFVAGATGVLATGVLGGSPSGSMRVYSHNGSNQPNANLGAVGSVNVVAGTTYWLVNEVTSGNHFLQYRVPNTFASASGTDAFSYFNGSWNTFPVVNAGLISCSYSITTTITALTGEWTSAVYDSQTQGCVATTYYMLGSYPSSTSGTLYLEGSDDAAFPTAQISQSFSNPSGIIGLSLSGKRYWRTRVFLSTPSSLNTPTMGGAVNATTGSFILEFNRTTTWISQPIDCSSDVTVYNSLAMVSQNFGGAVATTTTVTIATSADNMSYTSFVALGSHVVQRYAKIQVVLTAGQSSGSVPTYYLLTPEVTSITFTFTIVANLISSGVDTAVNPPAGWDVFQANFSGNVVYQLRSASTLGGLTGATFYTLTSGSFPDALTLPLQFVQWKAILTATADAVPVVDSVTVSWLISNTNSLRPASIIIDGRYFVALAETEQSTNNILLELDLDGRWRYHNHLAISTFSFFYNAPYFGRATSGQIGKFLSGVTALGGNIAAEARFKALDYSTAYSDYDDKYKIVKRVILEGEGTGASYQIAFSTDEGSTFTLMKLDDGTTTFASTADGKRFYTGFYADQSDGLLTTGRTIMYRVTNSDAFNINIQSLKTEVYVREGDVL